MLINFKRRELAEGEHGLAVWKSVEEKKEVPLASSALILCDVWDDHHASGAVIRLNELLPKMERFVKFMRDNGAFIIHAPSDTMDFYADTPARKRMACFKNAEPAVVNDIRDVKRPVDASDGGDDSFADPRESRRVWTRQNPVISIDMEADGISDDGAEVYGYLKNAGINRVFIMGVHTNMCIMDRPFAIRNLVRWGFETALARDLTDLMYNPARAPYVSHEEGLALTIGYIEKFWCPTVAAEEIMYK